MFSIFIILYICRWEEIIVPPKDSSTEIRNLKANTMYAVYVKTLTISKVGAISSIKYHTVPDLREYIIHVFNL